MGGHTCEDVLDTLDKTLSENPSKWVVLVCGENDFFYRSASDTFSLFQSIVEKIQQSNARTVYMGTKPEPETVDLHDQYREYDAKIKEYAISLSSSSSPPPLVMIDVYNGFEDVGNPNSLYAEDQLHLSQEGYSYWNTWLKTALNDEACTIWKSNTCVQ